MNYERFAGWFEEAAQAGWPDAADFLAELRGAGYEIFRPGDCARTFITTTQAYERNVKAGLYRLVPVGGEG